MSTPSSDHRAKDGNAMTGYDQKVALDGDASNQARTVFGFDGNAMTAPAPKAPTPKAPSPAAPEPSAPAPKPKAAPKLGPQKVKMLEPSPERKNLEPIQANKVEPKLESRPKARYMPKPPGFGTPKPRPPR